MKELIEENKRKRGLFLKKLYELSGGVAGISVDVRKIRDALGFTEKETEGFRKYFKGEGSINAKGTNLAVYVSLTDNGIKEVENMIVPEKPAEQTSFINNGTIINSPIQQGTHSSSQTVTFSQQDIEKVKEYVEDFKKKLPEMNLSEDEADEADAMVKTAEIQISSKKPNREILKTSVRYLGAVAEKVGVNLISHGIIEGIKGIF